MKYFVLLLSVLLILSSFSCSSYSLIENSEDLTVVESDSYKRSSVSNINAKDKQKTIYGNSGEHRQDISRLEVLEIAKNGYDAIAKVNAQREYIMNQVKILPSMGPDKEIQMPTSDTNNTISIDISTGAGALVLDDLLQELSTVEQVASQLVATENKADKQIHSVTGQ